MNKNIINHISLFALLCTALISCTKDELMTLHLNDGTAASMAMNVKALFAKDIVELKSGDTSPLLTNVYGSDQDGFIIEEYVSDMAGNIPETKGWEIKTGNIADLYGQFNVMEFLDTITAGTKIPAKLNEFNLTSKYSGGKWNWYDGTSAVSDEDAPKWRTNTATTLWSYAPVSAPGRSTISPDSVTGWATDTTTTLSFSHTVPYTNLADQKDLLFAYNVETRAFVKDDKGNYPIDPVTNKPIFEFVTGQDENVDIKFYHALAAVKFEVESTEPGANIHSITLCKIGADDNIILDDGIATSGSCVATGSGTSSGAVRFDWNKSDLDDYTPLHYVFPDTYSNPANASTVAGGYASSGEGVSFMIPQSGTGLKLIVQFSKYGGSQYYTRVYNTGLDVNWVAGKYYIYRIKIGEFHVPGEKYPQLSDISIRPLDSGKLTGILRPEGDGLPTKGVTKVGLVLNDWAMGSKDDQTVYLNGVKDGVDQVPGLYFDKSQHIPANTSFSYNFAGVSAQPLPNTNNLIYSFASDDIEETYHSYYSFSPPTGPGKNSMGTPKAGPHYYVFDCTGANKFHVYFKPSAGDSSGAFSATVRCMLVLDVAKDPNLPKNWDYFLKNWPNF